MTFLEFLAIIGVESPHPGLSDIEIDAEEARLGGRLPELLREWCREANGFEGEAGDAMWSFPPMSRWRTITRKLKIIRESGRSDEADGRDYVIFCDAMVDAPAYTVNVREGCIRFSEVICTADGKWNEADFSAPSLEIFAELLCRHPDKAPLMEGVWDGI